MKYSLFIIGLMFSAQLLAQPKSAPFLATILDKSDKLTHILSNPDSFRVQIIYTQINRDKKGKPSFENYYYHVDPDLYFNPASMVKMPLAFLSLEKLHQLKLDKHTAMQFDSSYPRQKAMTRDLTSKDSLASIAHFIKRALLISENDPYNRMYQFLGQGPINASLKEKGYSSSIISRQFMGFTEEENKHTNRITFHDQNGKVMYDQPAAYNTIPINYPETPILVGKQHINRDDQLVNTPFDFTRHNNISLEDMQQMLQAVIFPESVAKQKRFDISEDDRKFLLQYLSQYPSETNYPKYADSVFYDSYVKFFFKDSTGKMPDHLRVFNKVGWAYGFLTDVSYILDTKHNVDYFLSATIYVNSDGVVNDSKYDEETIGFPFFREVGRLIYKYEVSRERTYQSKLTNWVNYDKRDKSNTRPTIKEADN